MADTITTLHPQSNPSDNIYPNIKKDNIPNGSIDSDKMGVHVFTHSVIMTKGSTLRIIMTVTDTVSRYTTATQLFESLMQHSGVAGNGYSSCIGGNYGDYPLEYVVMSSSRGMVVTYTDPVQNKIVDLPVTMGDVQLVDFVKRVI